MAERYQRINLDGLSVTRTELVGASAVLPGAVVKLASGLFVAHATAGKKQDFIYVVTPNAIEGGKTGESIAASKTAVAEFFETGRELAVLIKAATVLVVDSPLTSNADGTLKLATLGTDEVIAYSQEALTVGAAAQLVRVRAA